MYEITARDFPVYAGVDPQEYTGRSCRNNLYGKKEKPMEAERIHDEERTEPATPARMRRQILWSEIKRRHGIALVLVMGLGFYGMLVALITGSIVHSRTEKTVRAEMAAAYEQQLQDHKDQLAEDEAAKRFLSGDASREAFIQQEDVAVAGVISKLATDQQKLSEGSCMLARVMNPAYPNTFKEVAEQAQQWMFYDGSDKTYSQHDLEIADSIVRPYIERGIIPNGLTSDMVYGSWSPNDFVLRDSYLNSATMHTWRYQG